jgi:hypothetical protein
MKFSLCFLAVCTALLSINGLCYAQNEPPPPPPPPIEANDPTTTPPPSVSGGRTLLLPDISITGIQRGLFSSDKRDTRRNKYRLKEAEVAVQGFIYPGIRAENFIVFADGAATVEESYVSVQNLKLAHLPFSASFGRRKVPIGRVNQLHPHSWLYIVQPTVLNNLISSESLAGDGVYASYLAPTSKLFLQVDAGFWNLFEPLDQVPSLEDSSKEILTSPGTGLKEGFTTLRVQAAKTLASGGDIEIGESLIHGRSADYVDSTLRPNIDLTGTSITYRKLGSGSERLLLRSEYYNHKQRDGAFHQNTSGYYMMVDHRLNATRTVGVRYDESGFPYAPGLREHSASLIVTHSLTETTYLRGQLIHGDRPGKRGFNEIHLQLVFGLGPHTHNLE